MIKQWSVNAANKRQAVKIFLRVLVVLCGYELSAFGQTADIDHAPVSVLYDRVVSVGDAWADFSSATLGERGNLWLAVNSFQLSDDPKLMLPRILRISPDGKVEAEVEIKDPSPEKTPRAGKLSVVGMKQLKDSTLSIIVSYSGHDLWWVTIDSNGKELSSTKLIVLQKPFVVRGAIIEPEARGVLLYGNQIVMPTAMYVEQSGKLDWTVQLPEQKGMFSDAVRMPTGDFALLAQVTKNGSGDSELIWTSSKGTIQQQPLSGLCFKELVTAEGSLSGLVSRSNQTAVFTTNSPAQPLRERQVSLDKSLLKPVLAHLGKDQVTVAGIEDQEPVITARNLQTDSKLWQKRLSDDPIADFDIVENQEFIYMITPTFSFSGDKMKQDVRIIKMQLEQ